MGGAWGAGGGRGGAGGGGEAGEAVGRGVEGLMGWWVGGGNEMGCCLVVVVEMGFWIGRS